MQQLGIPDFLVERFKYYYQQAIKVNWITTLQAGPPFTPIMLSNVPLPSLAKQKRNQKTRAYHKKKKAQAQIQAQSNHVTSQIQEVEHTGVRVYINEKVSSKHMVLKHIAIWMATSVHAAVIHLNDFMDEMVLNDHWTNGMCRMGVG